MNALISVIMPAYNCEKFVKQAIESILNQTYSNFELLVADDCSTDSTKKLIDTYDDVRIKRFHNTKNLGYLEASNLLMAKATGEYVTFQDADDYSENTRFEKMLNAFKNNPSVSALSSNVIYADENSKSVQHVTYPITHEQIYSHFLNYRIPLVGSALIVKREVIQEVGLYNKYFDRIGTEDMYWFSQIIQKFTVLNLDEFLYYYRLNPASVSNRNLSYRSVAGFNTCVYYMKERAAGRVDHINSGEWQKADDTMRRFFVSHKLEKGEQLSFSDIRKMSQGFIASLKLYLFQLRHKKK